MFTIWLWNGNKFNNLSAESHRSPKEVHIGIAYEEAKRGGIVRSAHVHLSTESVLHTSKG